MPHFVDWGDDDSLPFFFECSLAVFYYSFDYLDGIPFSRSLEENIYQRAKPIIYAYVEELYLRDDSLSHDVISNLLSNIDDSTEKNENAQKLYDGIQNDFRVPYLIKKRDAACAANDYASAKSYCKLIERMIPDDEVNNSIYEKCRVEEYYADIFVCAEKEEWYNAKYAAENFLIKIAPDDPRVPEVEKELDRINEIINKENSSSSSSSSSKPLPKVTTVTKSFGSFNKTDDFGHDKFDAAVVAEKIVKQNLTSPSSADFCKNSELVITLAGTTGNMTSWTVTGYVDAANSFGAVIRNNYTAQFTFTSSKAYTIDSCIFF